MDWHIFYTHREVIEMSTEKKFAVAGVSTLGGKTKVRFANDTMRIKILAKNGHTDVNLVDLPREMTKAEIAQHMVEVSRSRPLSRRQRLWLPDPIRSRYGNLDRDPM